MPSSWSDACHVKSLLRCPLFYCCGFCFSVFLLCLNNHCILTHFKIQFQYLQPLLISSVLSVSRHEEYRFLPFLAAWNEIWTNCYAYPVSIFLSRPFSLCVWCVSSCTQPPGRYCHPGLVYWPDVCHSSPHLGPPHSVLHQEEQGWQISR